METESGVGNQSPNPELRSTFTLKCANDSSEPSNTIAEKASAVLKLLNEDIKAADLKWSLFIAASECFRHDTCLKPFPPMYIDGDTKDFDAVMDVIFKTVKFVSLLELLKDPLYVTNNKEVVDLLHYVLVQLREPYLRSVQPEDYDGILKKVISEGEVCRPQYIFEVVNTDRSQAENKWKSLSANKKTFFAYHGSKLENFHSIIHHGLQQHLNKINVFGSGTYLSSELLVSLPYSPGGLGWGRSGFGPEISCLAMCELIQTDGVYCQKTEAPDLAEQIRSKVGDSIGGEVPQKYFVVANNDLVRVRYLLVYAKDPTTFSPSSAVPREAEAPLRRWFAQHKLLTLLFGYSFMLASIGFANNNHMQYYYRMLLKKVESAIKSLKF